MADPLGDRMKMYEHAGAGQRVMPLLPVIARVDGRAFHRFTQGLQRPFDAMFAAAMQEVAIGLACETRASMVHTQSDEITLCWHSQTMKSQIWFDGRVSKMTSQLGALATLLFYRKILNWPSVYAARTPTFDARVWAVPNRIEAANVFLWREQDAVKNSISMAAHTVCSHHLLQGKNSSQKQEMLFEKGINWNDFPAHFKRGIYVQRRKVSSPFTADELASLPPKHRAHANPDLVVERSVCTIIDMPPFAKMTNKVGVLFDGEEPRTA